MTWAWASPLPPTPKLVLMALADIADDHGVCWPSHKTLALKCSLTDRTVRRVLAVLQAQHLLSVERRFRQDGSRTSNGYRLAIEADPPGQIVRGIGHPRPGEGSPVTGVQDTDVLPRTTNEPSNESPLPPRSCGGRQVSAASVDDGGGDLFFPNGLTQAQKQALHSRVGLIAPQLAQQALDELAGRMAINLVKNPVRYCAALIERMQRGDFLPELGLNVAARRRAELARRAVLTQIEETAGIASKQDAQRLPGNLRRAVERMRSKNGVKP